MSAQVVWGRSAAGYHAAGVVTLAEREAFELVVERGLSQRSAALVLGISRRSVRERVWNASRKIGAFEGRRAA